MQDLQIELVRPPVAVGCTATCSGMVKGAFRFSRHVLFTFGRVHPLPGQVQTSNSDVGHHGTTKIMALGQHIAASTRKL
jgi:hypothetical protein